MLTAVQHNRTSLRKLLNKIDSSSISEDGKINELQQQKHTLQLLAI